MNEIIKWTQKGQVFFWRYTENIRNYPGWHLALDLSGGNSVLVLLSSMKLLNEPTMRTVRLTKPGPDVLAIPNNPKSGIVAKDRLRIDWTPEPKNEWSIDEQDDEVVMALGKTVLANIEKAIENPKKAFDTTIALDPFLWFWGIIDKSAANNRLQRIANKHGSR
jgi:hypothetical protein